MNLPSLTVENIATGLGVFAAGVWIAIKTYFARLQAEPTTPKVTDVIVSGGTIADMAPFRAIEKNTDRMATAMERMASSGETLLKMMKEQAQDDAIEEEVERRLRQRQEDRRRRTTRT